MKKITKFLDSVMGGIKRTCIAKALAVFAVASIAINANAQAVDGQGVITGMQDLVGLTEEQVRDNLVTSSSTFPTSPGKQFFLYNVGTGRFLNAGGYWGTHVSLQEYGKPIAAIDGGKSTQAGAPNVARLNFFTDMRGANTQGQFIGWVGVPGDPNVQAEEDNGVWVDRKTEEIFGWVIEPTGDDKNTFKIYTYAHSTFKDNQYVLDYSKKYYLCSNKGVVDAAKNCEAYSEDDLNDYSGYDTWRIFSYKQILDLQVQNASDFTDALELSFKLKCPGFSRGDNDIKSWNTYNYNINKYLGPKNNTRHEFARYGLQYYYNNKIAGPNTTGNFTEESLPTGGYTFNGKTYTRIEKDFHRDLSKYYCASITNQRGVLYQDIDVTLEGTYKIECKGFSTTAKAKLFAGVLDPADAKKETMLEKALNAKKLNQVSDMSQTVQDELHVSEKNVDYAGKNFYGTRDFVNTVYVTVPKNAFTADGKATIRLGIMIGDNQNDKKPVTTGNGEWTVFDDFRMLYAEREVNEDLILDEMRDNLTYLVNCPTPMKNKTLRLNKTFTLNKWNSFILPVNLNKKQVTEAFGGSARLAKLTGLTESGTGIEFTSVNLLDDNSTAIEAYVPYIIFPVKPADQTNTYTANYKQKNKTERLNINIPANHYVIGKVSMPLTADGKANDWSKMKEENWTTTLTGGNDQIKAYGTFARTFGTVQTDNEDGTYTWTNNGKIITGRDDLKGCYFFDKGNMYHSSSDPEKYRPRGLRGFSCWFKMAEGSQNSLQLTIDGVTQSGTTGIEDILADYEQPVSRFANGIYNLNGQLVKQGNSTAGLPSGLYIVNGKKCIVR
ncbi:MAG: hypothetical protein SO296_01775 [Prevotella sp.]|nr:hypothetical protein [Prevotella sp.]